MPSDIAPIAPIMLHNDNSPRYSTTKYLPLLVSGNHHTASFLRAHLDLFAKLSNPALMSSHMYVEFDRKIIVPINLTLLSPSVCSHQDTVAFLSTPGLCHYHCHSTTTFHAKSVPHGGKYVVSDAREAQMMVDVIWALGKLFSFVSCSYCLNNCLGFFLKDASYS